MQIIYRGLVTDHGLTYTTTYTTVTTTQTVIDPDRGAALPRYAATIDPPRHTDLMPDRGVTDVSTTISASIPLASGIEIAMSTCWAMA